MDCPNCSFPLDMHRTGDCLIAYCERCGHEHRERRDPPRDRWTPEERARRLGRAEVEKVEKAEKEKRAKK